MTRTRTVCFVTAVVLVLAGVLLTLSLGTDSPVYYEVRVGPIPGETGLWYKSSVYGGYNRSFTVVVRSVVFMYLYTDYDPMLMDVPITLFFSLKFDDGDTELLNTTIGGMLRMPPRVVVTVHGGPTAAIVSAFDYDHWYEWYYAVSV